MAADARNGTRVLTVALLAAVAVGAGATAAAVATGAAALVAVAAHAVALAVGQALLLRAGRKARRQAGGLFAYGFGRERFFWPMVAEVVLLIAAKAGGIAAGVLAIDAAEPLSDPEWAYGVLGAGIVLTAATVRMAVSAVDGDRGRATRRRYVRSARAPEVPLVLLGHLGALLGLVLALAGVLAAEATGDPVWDGVGAVAVGIVSGLTAVVVVAEVRSMLIGGSASRRHVQSIVAAIEIDPSVRRLIHLRAQQMGPEELFVGAKVELDHTLTFPEVSEVVNRIERHVRSAVPMARLMFIEPDVTEERRAATVIDEHVPVHEVPEEIRARQEVEAGRGALGVGIPVEDDLSPR